MIRVGYVPYSKDLSHPADRRRLATWGRERKSQLVIELPLNSDILVLSNAANFSYWINRANQPVYLDLVDAYLGENPSFARDFLRNVLRTIQGKSSFRWITYSRHLKYAIKMSHGVIVPSLEQKVLLEKLNKNVFVIPDNHCELESHGVVEISPQQLNIGRSYIFWEGFGYTLKHFTFIARDLDRFLNENNYGMYLVTVKNYKKWGGKIGKVNTRDFINRTFPLSKEKIEIIPWSIENLVYYSKLSKFGIIPIDESDLFAFYKSENKLLSMWKLGLPVLYSQIPSYSRVSTEINQKSACLQSSEWFEGLMHFSKSPLALKNLKSSGMHYVNSINNHQLLVSKWDSVIYQTFIQISHSENGQA